MDSISSVTYQYVSGTVDAGSCKRDETFTTIDKIQ